MDLTIVLESKDEIKIGEFFQDLKSYKPDSLTKPAKGKKNLVPVMLVRMKFVITFGVEVGERSIEKET